MLLVAQKGSGIERQPRNSALHFANECAAAALDPQSPDMGILAP